MIAEHVDGWKVDLVVCSTARRARATAKPVIEALGCPVRYDDALYETTADGLLAVARELADDDKAVMFVGHNPSMEELTELLCGKSPEYPTAALGTITLDDRSLERDGTRARDAHRFRDRGAAARPTLMAWRLPDQRPHPTRTR